MDPCQHVETGRCDACFWLPAGARGVWALRVAGLDDATLATLRTFTRGMLAIIAEETETAEMLGLEHTHASALQAQIQTLKWDLEWPENAEELLEIQLERELGRQLPESAEDFSREVALFFFQAVSG